MNLNNKNLAIGLSVAAVLIVCYQVFFNKSEDSGGMTQSVNTPVAVTPAPVSSPSPSPGTTKAQTRPTSSAAQETTGVENYEIIDANSEILLKRIPAEMVQPLEPREIQLDFGLPIFTRTAVTVEEPQASSGPVREIEWVLNGIIMDSSRKLVIINNTILKIGDIIQGAQIISIDKKKVTLKMNQQEIILTTESKVQRLTLKGGTGER